MINDVIRARLNVRKVIIRATNETKDDGESRNLGVLEGSRAIEGCSARKYDRGEKEETKDAETHFFLTSND